LTALLERVTRVIETVLIVLLFGMFAMVTVLVVLRYLFSTTIIGGNEGTVVAFIFTTALGASIAIARDEHIAIDYFTDKMSPQARHVLTQVRLFLLVVINAVITVYAVFWIQRTGGFLMPTLGLPQLVAQVSVPIGCGLSAVYCAARLLR
jgi:TRAP-type C4-dicarboxylate transport system permease small subunit